MSSRRSSSLRSAARSRVTAAVVALLASLAAACGADGDVGVDAEARQAGPLAQALATSATESGVPRDLLVAIAVVEESLALPAIRDHLDVDNEVPAAGPLQLRRGKLDTLARGAALVGRSELDLRRDADLALRAGARVLAEIAAQGGANTTKGDVTAWADAVGTMSGFADDAHREKYVHDVYRVLARGGVFTGRDGERITVRPHAVPPALTLDVSSKITFLSGNAEYPDAEWFPTSCTNKCNTSRDGSIGYVLVHDTEGGWNASVATLQNDSGKSVHYIVGQDGRVGQFVPESYNAWHAGNGFYNNRSVGIEHVGYHDQPYPEALYAASAKLTTYLTAKYQVPVDRAHVIGHDQVPNGNRIAQSSAPCAQSPKACEASLDYGGASNHGDPGVWEWATYMPRLGASAKCNDVSTILNCSSDKTQAFRCVNGVVEVQACSACAVMPTGQDDACTPPGPAPTPTASDTGSEAAAPDDTTSSPPLQVGRDPSEPGADDPEPKAAADTGCAVTGARGAEAGTPAAFGLALALTVTLRRRRRAA